MPSERNNGCDVLWHTGVCATLPLTEASMPTDPSCSSELSGTSTRVHGNGLADDEAIGDELADGVAGVGVANFVDLVGVEPDLAFAAADD